MSYPNEPGFQNTDTSIAAAVAMRSRAPTVRECVLDCIEDSAGLATFEIAARLGKSYRTVQPRTSELRAVGAIKDSGKRRIDPDTGKAAIVWGLA
jgi:hypothetical protein